jgi:hypothetical protein
LLVLKTTPRNIYVKEAAELAIRGFVVFAPFRSAKELRGG